MGSPSCTGMRMWPPIGGSPTAAPGSANGIRIIRGSSGTVPWRCSQARSDRVAAATSTLVTSPPNALLTVSRSACRIEANATARRSVSGALNALCGSGPLIDDTAGGTGLRSLSTEKPPTCSRTARSRPFTVSATSHRPLNWYSRSSLTRLVTSSPTAAGMPGLGCCGSSLPSWCGSDRSNRDQMDAAPASLSLSAGDVRTASAHRPPDRPSMLHASQGISR